MTYNEANVRIDRRRIELAPSRARSTAGKVIYAIGDVHGCYDQLVAMFGAIVDDIAQGEPGTQPAIVLCGDYVDRGPRSADVLTALVWLERHVGVETVVLKGNHEELLLDFLDRPAAGLRWLQRDGHSTLRSYGVRVPDDLSNVSDEECRSMRDAVLDRMPAAHLALLRRMTIRVAYGDYLFVHAGLRPGKPIDRQTDEDCLWIRDDFLKSNHRFEKIIVHGHSWASDMPEITADRIGIDTGVYHTGVLTAVRLENDRVEVLQARRDGSASAPTGAMADMGDGGNR